MNIDKEFKIPFYAKVTILLIGLFAFFTILYIAQSIIIPIVFAIIIAIVLQPVVLFFERLRINRMVAIVITMLIAFSVIVVFAALIFSQARRFSESLPLLVDKFTVILNQSITWASGYFNINPQQLHDWITNTKNELLITGKAAIGQTIITVGNTLLVLLLVMVYIFMILMYQPLLIEFIRRLFGTNNKIKVNEIISQTRTLVQRYIRGLIYEAIIVAVLYSTGLLIIGIDYAILLGFIAAMLNIIPYIGGIIALSLIMIVTIATKDSGSFPLMVLGLSVAIHLIDNSFIIPKIVASKVRINALVSITAVLASSALLGVPGMIICIPVIGIVKLIFDHIEPLKSWGFLLGDTMPPLINIKPIIKQIKKII